jgi:glycosyltransferase involved in cell wall biosynthesis
VSWKSGVRSLPFGDGNVAVAYGAPPYGLGLSRYLAAVTDDIADHVPSARGKPDLIHAHKFSVEGLVAADLSRRLGVPFISSFWGDTDCKIVSAKRRLRGRYREVAAAAKLLLPAAPWTARFMTSTLDVPKDRMEILPIMTAASSIIAPQLSASGNLVSMFSLDSWKRKGLDVLVGAMKAIAAARPNVILDVYGGGSPRSFFDATTLIAEAGMTKTVVLRGPLPHDKVQETMNRYAAFVMAPRRETFGMVHVEALLAGLPVLWAKDRGIDGLIDESVGVRCDPNSIADVTAGIDYGLGNERDLKRKVARLQADGAFDHLRREGIARTYSEILSRMTSQGETASRRLLVAAG